MKALLLPLLGVAALPLLGVSACQSARADEMVMARQNAVNKDAPWLTLKSTEANTAVTAQFNPKEVSIDKSVPWKTHKGSNTDPPALEFTGAQPKKLDVELMFDLFESKGDVYSQYISALEQLALIQDETKRPPLVTVTWGTMPAFQGVISHLNVKYTMFLPDGTPCRATASIRMKQATSLLNSAESRDEHCSSDRDCGTGEICRSGFCADP